MGKAGKMKGNASQVERKPYTRGQARAKANPRSQSQVLMDALLSSPNHMTQIRSNDHIRFLELARDSEASQNSDFEMEEEATNEPIRAAVGIQGCQQSDHHSSSLSRDLRAVINNMLKACLNPAGADSAPPKEVKVAAANVSNNISSKLPQQEVGAKPNVDPCPEEMLAISLSDDANPAQSCKLGLTEVVNMWDHDSGDDEVDSSAVLVSVGCYKVKKASAPMLRSIFEKHGDIAANCILTTAAGRSMFLQTVCDIMHKLLASKFVDVSESEIKDMLDVVKEMGTLDLQLGWLQKRLEEILDSIKLIKEYPNLKEAKTAKSKAKKESRKALKCYEDEILNHEAIILAYKAKMQESGSAVQALKRKALLEQKKLAIAKAESKHIKESVSNCRAKVVFFINTSLIQDLC